MKPLTYYSIGENAGKLWCVLERNTELTVSQMKDLSELDSADLYAAIGWLAREGKIFCREQNGDLYFSNRYIQGSFVFG